MRAETDAELQAIALSLELDPGATAAEIRTALTARLAEAVDGGLQVQVGETHCAVATNAAIVAASRCDSIGPFKVRCAGECAPADGACEDDATMTCTGAALDLKCSGSCTGDCVLEVAAVCGGTCRGDCSGTCSVRDVQGRCAGRCDGTCQGTCTQGGGGGCAGRCEGLCASAAPPGGCAAKDHVTCGAEGDPATVCEGQCDGKLIKARRTTTCEVAALAMSNLGMQCDPPGIEVTWQWSGALADDAAGQVAFQAWVAGLQGHLARVLATARRSALLLQVGSDLWTAAETVVEDEIKAKLETVVEFRPLVGLACLLTSLGRPVELTLNGSFVDLQAVLADASEVGGVLTSP